MNMKKITVAIIAWMALLLGLGLWLSGSGHKHQPTAIAPTNQPEQTQTVTGPAPVIKPTQPLVPQQQGIGTQAPALQQAGAANQQRLLLATSGWPALAKMPWREGSVSADYAGYAQGQVVLVVKFGADAAKARRLLTAFLKANHDFIGHYSLRFLSSAAATQQQQISSTIDLANRGYHALPYLPLRLGSASVFATALGAHPALRVDYRGSLPQAKRDAAALLANLNDSLGHYRVSYHRGGRLAPAAPAANPAAEPNYKPTLPPRLRKKKG